LIFGYQSTYKRQDALVVIKSQLKIY